MAVKSISITVRNPYGESVSASTGLTRDELSLVIADADLDSFQDRIEEEYGHLTFIPSEKMDKDAKPGKSLTHTYETEGGLSRHELIDLADKIANWFAGQLGNVGYDNDNDHEEETLSADLSLI